LDESEIKGKSPTLEEVRRSGKIYRHVVRTSLKYGFPQGVSDEEGLYPARVTQAFNNQWAWAEGDGIDYLHIDVTRQTGSQNAHKVLRCAAGRTNEYTATTLQVARKGILR
jgi:hypothetical protein